VPDHCDEVRAGARVSVKIRVRAYRATLTLADPPQALPNPIPTPGPTCHEVTIWSSYCALCRGRVTVRLRVGVRVRGRVRAGARVRVRAA
jgi:hypothetical protein